MPAVRGSPDVGVGGFIFEVVCGVCARWGVEILFEVSAKQCRDHPRKELPANQFRVFWALPNPKVEIATSRSRLGDYIKWCDITKVLSIPSKTALLEILFEVSAKQ